MSRTDSSINNQHSTITTLSELGDEHCQLSSPEMYYKYRPAHSKEWQIKACTDY